MITTFGDGRGDGSGDGSGDGKSKCLPREDYPNLRKIVLTIQITSLLLGDVYGSDTESREEENATPAARTERAGESGDGSPVRDHCNA